MSKKSTKLKNILSEHYILGELPSSKLMKMKWNPVTGETMNEDDTNEYGGMSSSDEKAPKMKDSKETENIKKIFQMANLAKKGGGSGDESLDDIQDDLDSAMEEANVDGDGEDLLGGTGVERITRTTTVSGTTTTGGVGGGSSGGGGSGGGGGGY